MATKKFSDLVKSNTTGKNSCTTVQDLIDRGIPINKIPTNTGLFNTRICRTQFSYNTPSSAHEIENEGAYIVMGSVPPGGLATGYGAKGIPAESIDLVVGRNSSADKGKGPKKDSFVDNNFASDAARIYVSRLTDIDEAFGLVNSPIVNGGRGLIARSGIGIKADGVRIIGREGVKIVTGKMSGRTKFGMHGETNSLGGKLSMPAPKIELIAGNNYDNVQGVALGETTRDSLRELHDIVGELWSAVFNLALIQAGLNTVVGVNLQAWISAAAPVANMGIFTNVLNSLYATKTNALFWKFNYLQPSGPTYIVSRNVKTN